MIYSLQWDNDKNFEQLRKIKHIQATSRTKIGPEDTEKYEGRWVRPLGP